MKKLIEHNEIEYDFSLEFDGPLPFPPGQTFDGMAESKKEVHRFDGVAYIVATRKAWMGPGKTTTVYFRIAQKIHC